MKKTILFLSLLVLIVGVQSCKKKCKEAGLGGNLTVVAFLQHHTKPIINHVGYSDTVYVKYNTQDFPGVTVPHENPPLTGFDTYFVGEEGEDHVHLEGLKCGDYYIYGVGMDTTGPYRVLGGIPFSTDKESGEVDLNLPVSED